MLKFRAYQDDKMLIQEQEGIYATKKFFSNLYEDCELMECTGVKDITGRDIYVKDILSERWQVEVYKDNSNTFMIKFHVNPKVNKPMRLNDWITRRTKAGTINDDNIIIGNTLEM